MCSPKPWTEILSTVLLGLRNSYKEDLQASPAEMLYGTTLRIPGEFFINNDSAANPQIFVEKHREYMRGLRPTNSSSYKIKDIYSKKPPYLHNGTLKDINIDRLKPTYISKTDTENDAQPTVINPMPEHHWSATTNIPTKHIKKKVSFNLPSQET
ncbi:uncharacterized protein LOC122520486 [Polistes fuscatus]|uniref:uncharacterized protein LOC122520486 n=1 Tax=Polistes fuscatus TaxID=30207 RepID=UPI001CA84110|nr:uncharacterized protein LOC122520486 [Polistes fuscatus]